MHCDFFLFLIFSHGIKNNYEQWALFALTPELLLISFSPIYAVSERRYLFGQSRFFPVTVLIGLLFHGAGSWFMVHGVDLRFILSNF